MIYSIECGGRSQCYTFCDPVVPWILKMFFARLSASLKTLFNGRSSNINSGSLIKKEISTNWFLAKCFVSSISAHITLMQNRQLESLLSSKQINGENITQHCFIVWDRELEYMLRLTMFYKL